MVRPPPISPNLCFPAGFIGLKGKGVIAPGMDADPVALDSALDVCAIYVVGQKVWPAPELKRRI